jgi:FAD/FMN-containing dehydrogenase
MPRFWDIRPRVVVHAASAEDVAQVLAFAAASGLPVVPRGGGHCFAGRSSTDGIVLDLTPLASPGPSTATTRSASCASPGPSDRTVP